jgi:hypothetical protein
MFFEGLPGSPSYIRNRNNWTGNLEKSIDQFIAYTIAYGHIGWLVEESFGMRRTCRSYYLLQQLPGRYALEKPEKIMYGDGESIVSSSAALLSGAWKKSRLYLRYPKDLEIWVNGGRDESWNIQAGKTGYALPPFGWVALQGRDFFTGSWLDSGSRCDWVSSPAYVFVDGRGVFRNFDGMGTAGSIAVRQGEHSGISVIAVEGVDRLAITGSGKHYPGDDVRNAINRIARADSISVQAFDVKGKSLNNPGKTLVRNAATNGNQWDIPTSAKAVQYEITVKLR